MADKFNPGDRLKAKWKPANPGADFGLIDVTVIDQPSPGQYRCQTNMGIAVTFQEDDLHAPADTR